MSAVDTIRIQGSEDSFSSDKFTINTNVYIVNRLFAKSGKGDNPLRLHYKSRGVWIKCEHQSPLKRYAKMELEFRSFEKPVDSNDLDENVEYDLDGNEIENTEYLDKLNAMMEEAAMIRSLFIAARKRSQLKHKQVKQLRRCVNLTREEIDELLEGKDFY